MFIDKKVLTNIKTGIIFNLTINIKYLTKGNFQMKENAINKINKVGHIGFIITKIVRIALYIGLVGAIIGEVVLCFLPSDLFEIHVGGEATVSVSKQALSKLTHLNETRFKILSADEFVEGGKLNLDGDEYVFANISDTADSIIFNGNATAPSEITLGKIRWAVGLAVVIIVCALVLFKFVSNVCKSLSACETPFEEGVITSLNKFSYVLIGYAVIKVILASIISDLFAGAASVSVNIDITTILFALGIYVLSIIFKYGAILQKESDETL